MLSAERSRVQIPIRSFDVFRLPKPSNRTTDLRLTQPLTNYQESSGSGGKARPERKADNLTATCEPIV
jgi:hypothetical protein